MRERKELMVSQRTIEGSTNPILSFHTMKVNKIDVPHIERGG